LQSERDDKRPPKALKALGLLSGGLDSTLAALLLQEQGIEVEGVHFSTGFCKVDHRRALRRPADAARPSRLKQQALRAGSDLCAPVEVVDVAEEYLREVVLHPKYGYGSAMNPCIDCRIFMLRKAAERAGELGADVVFTGEVVGQRPMSQHHAALRTIEADSGLAGRLLRPLSAAHLDPTEAERDGRIDRSKLGALHGRGRGAQLELARRFGLDEFPAPSGGCCFLADRSFARRLRDLLDHTDPAKVTREDLVLLKVGRHFRLAHDTKVVLGRDEPESRLLRLQAGERWTCQVESGKGSFGVVEGEPDELRLLEAASLAARYCAARADALLPVALRRAGESRRVEVAPASDETLERWRI